MAHTWPPCANEVKKDTLQVMKRAHVATINEMKHTLSASLRIADHVVD